MAQVNKDLYDEYYVEIEETLKKKIYVRVKKGPNSKDEALKKVERRYHGEEVKLDWHDRSDVNFRIIEEK